MGRGKKRVKIDQRGPLQKLLDREQVANDQSVLSVITPEQRAKGTYEGERRIVNRSIVEKWFDEGHVGFGEGARLAIEWCHKRWEARGVIGRQSASYEANIGCAGGGGHARDVELRDEIDVVRGWFHPAHWDVFEGVVRWGQPAGTAGSELAANPAQAIASARVVVGMIASFIAAKKGY